MDQNQKASKPLSSNRNNWNTSTPIQVPACPSRTFKQTTTVKNIEVNKSKMDK